MYPLQTRIRILAARMAPELSCEPPSRIRGRGECRVPNAPAASCALGSGSMHTSIHSGGTGYIRHSPRNGFNSLYVISPGTGLSCPRRSRDKPATLAPASGRQDHTTSPSAPARSSCVAAASTASRPDVRDDRDTPLLSRRDGANTTLIWVSEKEKYFCGRGWTENSQKLPDGQISWPAAKES